MMWSTELLAVSIICLCHQAHMARYLNYQRKAMLDDFIPTHGSLYTGLTRSKIECSTRCESVTGIQSFFYVQNTNACECYGTSYATSDGLSSVPSAKYYEKQVLDCDDPPGVDNATVTSGAIVQGSERSYTCNVGYSEINNASMTVTCQQDGTWTEVAFVCVQETCPAKWFQIEETCYFYPDEEDAKTDVFSAMDYCHGLSGYLVEFKHQNEEDAIVQYLHQMHPPKITVWIGLTDNGTESSWRWVETNENVTYTNWAPLQPNGHLYDNYARINPKKKWVDHPWNASFQPLCEKSLGSP